MVNNEIKYSKPSLEIVTISSADIITTSNKDFEFDIDEILGNS